MTSLCSPHTVNLLAAANMVAAELLSTGTRPQATGETDIDDAGFGVENGGGRCLPGDDDLGHDAATVSASR
jgi:hypothetical protein